MKEMALVTINANNIQRLELLDRLFDDVFSGKKRNTKRYKDRKIAEGYLLYEASENKNLRALVWVTKVETMPLSQVKEKVEEEKNTSLDDLLSRMRSHYPEISLDTKIEVVMHLTPSETYATYGVPDSLLGQLGEGYLQKVRTQ